MALKIGILTLPVAENYGGILQAIALYRTLYNQGHDVVLIYKKDYHILWKKIAIYILRKIPFHDFRNFKANHIMMKEWKRRKTFHQPFIEKEIFKISENLYTKRDLENFIKKEVLDVVIVGSDQVWRKAYINDKYYKSYFFDFLDGRKTKKIAYASSFGKDYWEGNDDIQDISELLKDFRAISTRELSGVDICKNTFGYTSAKHVLDPTLLMDKEFYLNEILLKYNISNISKGGLVTYVLDEEKEKGKIINFFKESLNLECINHLKGFNEQKTTYSVPEWLAYILYADFVVTDSFHGMVFSIIFEKDFIVIGNKDRGLDRFTSLLSLLGLEDRLFFNMSDIKNEEIKKIDYYIINKILEKNKKDSLDFLIGALNDK